MFSDVRFAILVVLLSSGVISAQIISSTTRNDPQLSIGGAAADETTYRLWQIGEGKFGSHSPLESPVGSTSVLDLKAPGKARREYERGYRLLQQKNTAAAIEHLKSATSLYDSFVAAHNALGSAYLSLKDNDRARSEFAKAVSLDNHLPGSFLNLACAEMAVQDYSAAEASIRRASAIAPLDLDIQTALAYGEFMNHDYTAAVATARQIHGHEHTGFAKVHLYAAAAWQAKHDLPMAEQELQTFLTEAPTSNTAPRVRQMLLELQATPSLQQAADPDIKISYSRSPGDPNAPEQGSAAAGRLLQSLKESKEISEAEATEAQCPACEDPSAIAENEVARSPALGRPNSATAGIILHASANEVAVFFVATNHRKSVTGLSANDVTIRDNHRPPNVVTGFRNEAQLPLRLGVVIDSSASVTGRFRFEQDAAIEFLRNTLTGKDDLGFVVGVSNSVLMVQDFTNDKASLSRAISQLAPSGGTALWDAVAFASDKLASKTDEQPVARLMVLISDGQNNSSKISLKQAIDRAQRDQVFVYTISTQQDDEESDVNSSVGRRALQTLADLTGGAAFYPGSFHRLNASFIDLQQLIRSRYLISYKPADFKGDGQYRPIEITAQKDGQRLRIYARRGYFASANVTSSQ